MLFVNIVKFTRRNRGSTNVSGHFDFGVDMDQ